MDGTRCDDRGETDDVMGTGRSMRSDDSCADGGGAFEIRYLDNYDIGVRFHSIQYKTLVLIHNYNTPATHMYTQNPTLPIDVQYKMQTTRRPARKRTLVHDPHRTNIRHPRRQIPKHAHRLPDPRQVHEFPRVLRTPEQHDVVRRLLHPVFHEHTARCQIYVAVTDSIGRPSGA